MPEVSVAPDQEVSQAPAPAKEINFGIQTLEAKRAKVAAEKAKAKADLIAYRTNPDTAYVKTGKFPETPKPDSQSSSSASSSTPEAVPGSSQAATDLGEAQKHGEDPDHFAEEYATTPNQTTPSAPTPALPQPIESPILSADDELQIDALLAPKAEVPSTPATPPAEANKTIQFDEINTATSDADITRAIERLGQLDPAVLSRFLATYTLPADATEADREILEELRYVDYMRKRADAEQPATIVDQKTWVGGLPQLTKQGDQAVEAPAPVATTTLKPNIPTEGKRQPNAALRAKFAKIADIIKPKSQLPSLHEPAEATDFAPETDALASLDLLVDAVVATGEVPAGLTADELQAIDELPDLDAVETNSSVPAPALEAEGLPEFDTLGPLFTDAILAIDKIPQGLPVTDTIPAILRTLLEDDAERQEWLNQIDEESNRAMNSLIASSQRPAPAFIRPRSQMGEPTPPAVERVESTTTIPTETVTSQPEAVSTPDARTMESRLRNLAENNLIYSGITEAKAIVEADPSQKQAVIDALASAIRRNEANPQANSGILIEDYRATIDELNKAIAEEPEPEAQLESVESATTIPASAEAKPGKAFESGTAITYEINKLLRFVQDGLPISGLMEADKIIKEDPTQKNAVIDALRLAIDLNPENRILIEDYRAKIDEINDSIRKQEESAPVESAVHVPASSEPTPTWPVSERDRANDEAFKESLAKVTARDQAEGTPVASDGLPEVATPLESVESTATAPAVSEPENKPLTQEEEDEIEEYKNVIAASDFTLDDLAELDIADKAVAEQLRVLLERQERLDSLEQAELSKTIHDLAKNPPTLDNSTPEQTSQGNWFTRLFNRGKSAPVAPISNPTPTVAPLSPNHPISGIMRNTELNQEVVAQYAPGVKEVGEQKIAMAIQRLINEKGMTLEQAEAELARQ